MILQNTPEWLEMRKSKVGASDAPIIMGMSPWKTSYELWEEKLGLREPPKSNPAMMRGHQLEPIARKAYCEHTETAVEPEVVFHPEYNWMMASLDGLSTDRSRVVEIKCPGKRDHDIAGEGLIPEKYYPQLQHQLAVIGLSELDYFSFNEESFHLVTVKRDDEFIRRMLVKEKEFWEKLQNFEPPELQERDYVQIDSDEFLVLAEEWKEISKELAMLKERDKRCRRAMIELASNRNSIGGGVKIHKLVRKGAVNYGAIPDLMGVDLDKYRKSPVECWKFSTKEKYKEK